MNQVGSRIPHGAVPATSRQVKSYAVKNSPLRRLTVFSVVSALLLLTCLLSYPVQIFFPSRLCEMVASAAGGQTYFARAFMVTVLPLATLVILYHVMPTRKYTWAFHDRGFTRHSRKHYVNAWRILSAVILFNCSILLWQSGGTFPLLEGRYLDAAAYGAYRSAVNETLSMTLASITLQIMTTTSIFIAFLCLERKAVFYRIASIALFLLSGLFSLARSFIPVAILIFFLSFLPYKSLLWRRSPLFVVSALFATLVLLFGLILYSSKAEIGVGADLMIERIIHGQWLGMPLYLYYFESQSASPLTFLHPLLLRFFGITISVTPGRELMEYINPAGVAAGSAGNIPTFFVGESYAVGGWLGIIFAVFYVAIILWFFSFVFYRMPKNYISCCLYGWASYKIFTAMITGVSAFLLSGLSFLLLSLLLWQLIYPGAHYSELGTSTKGPCAAARRQSSQLGKVDTRKR